MTAVAKPTKIRDYREFVMDSSRWDGFPLREDDILICTPAKCGTTWTQMICALLVLRTPELARPLTEYSPWLDTLLAPVAAVHAKLAAQTHRRFIKTHTPLDGLPWSDSVRYICVGRDPRDVIFSLQNHMANMKPEALQRLADNAEGDWWQPPQPAPTDVREWFRRWIKHSGVYAEGKMMSDDVLYFMQSFWPYRDLPNVLMVHYDDLKADLDGEMRRIAAFLGIEIPAAEWPALVQAASFANMKANADRLAPQVTDNVWRDPGRFFNKGASGQWRDVLSADDLALYRQVVAERLDPQLAHWLEHGRLG